LRADTLGRLDRLAVEQFGQDDRALKQLGPGLGGDPQRIAEALRLQQQGRVAVALKQRIGGYRRAHLHAVDPLRRDGFAWAQAKKAADARSGL